MLIVFLTSYSFRKMDGTQDEWSRESLFLEYVEQEDFPEEEIFLQLSDEQMQGENDSTKLISAIIGEIIKKAVDISKCKKTLFS